LDRLKGFLKVAALLVVCIGIPAIAWALARMVMNGPIATTPPPTYAELVAIVLTAVTVVLAALAIMIAILAVWGYQSIKTEAAGAAERAIQSSVSALVQKHVSEESIQKLIAKEVKLRIGTVTLGTADLYPDAFDVPRDVPERGAVGTEYPKGDVDEG
jgi:hypothetical protein